ncbi:Gfo/Idh/MocA family oxidoreductase [Labedella phragmitis]|uniref:Gfo/Idh/MocA family oxidoreductase n=1 Tax=Labedella phragmitis TaxID=2498849 RepID=A0A3S4BLI3_9MICO|nr:Gfo/Idh/MocA family oxidoreductase [Labedella phragmitis]RWZ52766.1 Gfo/Idh/MocA family oxidoreductase [Labedella phragmitis]
MSGPVGVGVIGAGVISDTYLENLRSFPDVSVVIVGDLIEERAKSQAEKHGVPAWGSAADVLGNDDVQVVVNLTIPAAHLEISSAAIAAGKHVWSEKPLGLDRAGGARLLADAASKGLRVGSAPDTILGPGFQSAKRALQEGLIGEPMFATTTFQTIGPDLWHPSPAFLFAEGAGPLLDMGPYYFSGLVSLFGPVDRVAALGRKKAEVREIHSGPDAGTTFPVEVPTSLQVLTSFAAGQQASSLLSFDSALERHGVFEVHGTEGSLIVPDPNQFEGRSAYVRARTSLADGDWGEQEWIEIEQKGTVVGRGLGLLDMVRAISEGRPHVATGELGFHVLDVMLSAQESVASGEFVTVDSSISAPVPSVPVDFDPFASTL